MKIGGRQIDLKNYVEVVVIPRGDEAYVFKAKPLTRGDYETFDALIPLPAPPNVTVPGGIQRPNLDDPSYLQQKQNWAVARTNFMFIQSLKATDDLEWETVVEDDPTTWTNVTTELENSGFTDKEIGAIYDICIAANGLSQDKIEKATKDFLAMRASQEES